MPTADTTAPVRPRENGDGDEDVGFAGENVLVLEPADGDGGDVYCGERISPANAAASPNALLISIEESPDDRFDALRRSGVSCPANVAVVCCDETRGAAAATPASGVGPGPTTGSWTTTVGSPADLTGLGVRIRQVLSSWEGAPQPVELCFHTLDTLLEHVDDRAAFRFCHLVTRHVRSVGANSHFHLTADAVDERTLNTLRPLFDRVEDRR